MLIKRANNQSNYFIAHYDHFLNFIRPKDNAITKLLDT